MYPDSFVRSNVVENKKIKILWGFTIQCDHMIEAGRPDIVIVDKIKKETMIIDVAVPGDARVCDNEKRSRNCFLKSKIARLWQMKKVVVIPIVVGVLGTVTTKFEKYIQSLGIDIRIGRVQKSTLLETTKIIRKVPFCYVSRK